MTRRSVLRRLALGLAAAVAANVVLSLVSRRHDVVVISLAVLCLVALGGALVDGSTSLAPARWTTDRLVDEPLPRSEATLGRYQRLLEQHWTARRLDDGLQRRLLALAERRLLQSRGLTRDTDPEEVRRRLGPELGSLEARAPRRLTPAQIDRIIDRIEEL
ncbi:MAG TPA: hypothetical protein VFM09_01545 [Marmoricola sp.]|nr:hypothetical protein [Marmoricola sp.]